MVIEGFTLVLMAASYLYLRQNEYDWPPGRTPDPDLLIPTINTALLLLVMVPMHYVERASERFDRAGVTRGLFIAMLMTLPVMILRWYELLALNARWDTHAYASAAWATVVLHTTLLVTDFFETGTFTALFASGRAQNKHYPDTADAALYQYYLSLSWVPLYLLVYWGPRIM
jgi:cytochrome c oxidase subunit I+III